MSIRSPGTSASMVALVTPRSDLDYGSRIETILGSHRSRLTIERFDPTSDSELPPPGMFDFVIVTGSTARVHQPDPWIDELAAHLRERVDHGTPAFGVCFGHRLLAAGLGGTVSTLPERAAGFRPTEASPGGRSPPLFAGHPDRYSPVTRTGSRPCSGTATTSRGSRARRSPSPGTEPATRPSPARTGLQPGFSSTQRSG